MHLKDFGMPFVIHGLAFLLDFILNLDIGKQSSYIDAQKGQFCNTAQKDERTSTRGGLFK